METKYFIFKEVTENDNQFMDYLTLRHEIFVEELQRVKPLDDDKLQAIETDRFDPYSRHLVAIHKEKNILAACARLILPNPNGLNAESRYRIEEHPYANQNKKNTGEISRMAISSSFRRRKEDIKNLVEGNPYQEISTSIITLQSRPERTRNHQPGLVMGMYREIYLLAREENIHYCIAAMDKNFSRLLTRIGYPFHPIGPENQQLVPIRQPYIISQAEMEKKLTQLHPEVLDFMQK